MFDLYQRPSSGHDKSALTDHALQENHVINWSQATVIDKESERFTRWIKWPYTSERKDNSPWTVMRQLPTEPRIRPLSWNDVFPSCQEPKELSTSFFWWRPLIEVETSFLPAGLREAQPCRYCFYSLVQKWVFRPAGATRCPDKVEILRSAPLCKISPLLGQKCGNTDPKTVKISNFGHTFALQRLLVWTIFTKFSAFVRVYM